MQEIFDKLHRGQAVFVFLTEKFVFKCACLKAALDYKINLFIRKLFRTEYTVVGVTKKISNIIGIEATGLFHNEEFRKLVKFEKLDEDGQKRINYELLVSGFTFGVLFLKHVASRNSSPESDIFKALAQELSSSFGKNLKEYGAKDEIIEVWDEAIRKRVLEYEEFYDKNQNDLPEPVKRDHFWQYIVSERAVDRIRQGKVMPNKMVFKLLFDWNLTVGNKIFKEVEKTLG